MTRGVVAGSRLRDKAQPSHYAICACGFAKRATADRCGACARARAQERLACACGRPKTRWQRRCAGCVRDERLAEQRERRTCLDCGGPKHPQSLRCRACSARWIGKTFRRGVRKVAP